MKIRPEYLRFGPKNLRDDRELCDFDQNLEVLDQNIRELDNNTRFGQKFRDYVYNKEIIVNSYAFIDYIVSAVLLQ